MESIQDTDTLILTIWDSDLVALHECIKPSPDNRDIQVILKAIPEKLTGLRK